MAVYVRASRFRNRRRLQSLRRTDLYDFYAQKVGMTSIPVNPPQVQWLTWPAIILLPGHKWLAVVRVPHLYYGGHFGLVKSSQQGTCLAAWISRLYGSISKSTLDFLINLDSGSPILTPSRSGNSACSPGADRLL